MKIRQILIAGLLALSLVSVGFSAWAQSTVEECQARIELVQGDLNAIYAAGGIGGGNPLQTYNSLRSKLQGAIDKLKQKHSDALQKLVDFRTAVIVMRDAAKPKLSAAHAGLLLDGDPSSGNPIDEGVNGAIECVALLP